MDAKIALDVIVQMLTHSTKSAGAVSYSATASGDGSFQGTVTLAWLGGITFEGELCWTRADAEKAAAAAALAQFAHVGQIASRYLAREEGAEVSESNGAKRKRNSAGATGTEVSEQQGVKRQRMPVQPVGEITSGPISAGKLMQGKALGKGGPVPRPSLAQQKGAVTRPALQWQQQVSKPWAPLQQQLVGWEADDTAAGGADNNKAKCLSYSSHIHDDKDPPTNVQKGMCMNVHRCTETPTKENGHYQGERTLLGA